MSVEIDFRCPEIVAKNAAKGLALQGEIRARRNGSRRRQGTRSQEPRQPFTQSTIKRMVSYFARHEVDKRGKNFFNAENPSAGYIAWMLWGGDEGRAWAIELKKQIGNAPDI